MKARTLALVAFRGPILSDVVAASNSYLAGVALTALESGTIAYAANHVGQRSLIGAPLLSGLSGEYALVLPLAE